MSTETAQARYATPREDLVTTILGVWLIGGAYLDGWAHGNTLSVLQQEGFFTPWHAVLYSGFAAIAGWTFWLAFRRRGQSGRWWLDAWPVGYRRGAAGVVVFMVGGLADTAWHGIFGIEVSLDAILSPSHLVLAVGAVLVLTSPVRSWWSSEEDGLRAAAGVGGLALATASVGVFLLYASPFEFLGPVQPYSEFPESHGYLVASHGLASYLVTSALIVVPLLLVLQRRPMVGTVTAITTPIALFPVIISEFPRQQSAGALMAIVAAASADWILTRLDAARGRAAWWRDAWRLPIAGAVVAVFVSSAHLLGLYLVAHVFWPTELWTGMVVSVGVAGGVLGWLATGAPGAARPRQARAQDGDRPAVPQDRDDLAVVVDRLP